MREAFVRTVPIAGPGDVAPIAALFDEGGVAPDALLGVIAQTEGDGHARAFFSMALELLLAERLGTSRETVRETVPILVIGGTAGLMTPHATLLCRREVPPETQPVLDRALALGRGFTAPLPVDALGTVAQVDAVAKAVAAAMKDAGIESPDDVACVEIKCPQPPASLYPGLPGGLVGARSRGASALGAAIALGEIDRGAVSDSAIGTESGLYARRASASSGGELDRVRIVVIGNRAGAPGTFMAGHGMMADGLDLAGAGAAFESAGLHLAEGRLPPGETAKLATAFVNAGADSTGACRGLRHTMSTDLLAAHSGHVAKAIAHAAVAGIAGTPLILGNAGAEHQGPPGGNLVCVIADHAANARP